MRPHASDETYRLAGGVTCCAPGASDPGKSKRLIRSETPFPGIGKIFPQAPSLIGKDCHFKGTPIVKIVIKKLLISSDIFILLFCNKF